VYDQSYGQDQISIQTLPLETKYKLLKTNSYLQLSSLLVVMFMTESSDYMQYMVWGEGYSGRWRSLKPKFSCMFFKTEMKKGLRSETIQHWTQNIYSFKKLIKYNSHMKTACREIF
jgi:hypothetical protein